MASRQMNYLRKHQKTIIAVLCVVCMVTFVIGPFLLDMINSARRGRNSNDPIAVTWVGGQVHDSELHRKRATHQTAVNFLRLVIATVLEKGGSPVVNGQTIPKGTPPTQIMGIAPGIPGDAGEQMIVRMMLLAKKADEMGIVVDREAAREFVRSISTPEVNDAEWPEILKNVSREGMSISVDQLLDQIAFDLKATHAATLFSQAGLESVPPGQVWEYHNRLNRRYVIEAYPVDVASFAAQVQEEPSDPALREMFNKGKARDPDPSSLEPGFHHPHKVAFDWLRIDFAPFLEAATKQVNDDQVAKQYELDIKQGKHKVIELPPDPTKTTEPAKPADPAAPTDSAKPTDPAKPPEAKPTEKSAEKPAEGKPTDSKPTDKPQSKPAEKPAEGEGAKDPCSQDQPVAQPTDKPAETKPGETKPADAKPADAKPSDVKAAETKPAETKPGETKPGEAPAAAPPAPAPPPKFKPYEEVKEEIRKELAQPVAQEAMKAAIEKAIAEVNVYGRKYRRWKDAQDAAKAGVKTSKAVDPGPLDLEAIAAKYGFKAGSSKLSDQHEIANYEIGQKVMEFDMDAIRMGHFQQLTFGDLAYRRGDVLYSPSPQPVNSTDPDVSYVYWRTAEEDPKEPTFDEVKKQVVDAWKLEKAFELAKAHAQSLADKAKEAKSLKDVVADPTKVTTTIPFSWLTTGSLAFGSGAPSLSQVPGIDLAGTEFMEGVFRLKPGEAGVAPNQSHRTVYVVRVVNQEPDESTLKEQFLESGRNIEVMTVVRAETNRTQGAMLDALDKDMRLVWERPPLESQR